MEQVTAYKASDGAIFKTIDEAQDHETSLVWRKRIEEFTDSGLSPYPNGTYLGMTRKVIIAWERYKTGA